MTRLPTRIHPAAVEESRAERRWYSARNADVAARFFEELDVAIAKIAERTPSGTVRSPPARVEPTGARRLHLRNFPYTIIYRLRPDSVEVIAIAHQKRRPGYWRSRR